jgi:hypothetical protein
VSKERLVTTTAGLYIALGVTLSLFGPSVLRPSPFDDLDWPPRSLPLLPGIGLLLVGLIAAAVVAILGFSQIYFDKRMRRPADDRVTWIALWANAIGALGLFLCLFEVDSVIIGLLFAPIGIAISSVNLLLFLGELIYLRS